MYVIDNRDRRGSVTILEEDFYPYSTLSLSKTFSNSLNP